MTQRDNVNGWLWDRVGVKFDTLRQDELLQIMLDLADKRGLITAQISDEDLDNAMRQEKK